MTLQLTFFGQHCIDRKLNFEFRGPVRLWGFQLSLNTAGGRASDSQFQAAESKAKDTQHWTESWSSPKIMK